MHKIDKPGYSGTPLLKKLGIKDSFKLSVLNAPSYYFELFDGMPGNVVIVSDKKPGKDLVHYFTKRLNDLERDIVSLRKAIVQNGMVWISWPKKSSKVPTDITEDLIRAIALKNGLVDIKVCAVDETWSGLKLVIPVKDRKSDIK